MAKMEQVLALYQQMAERCEKSGVAPNQARVYREMITFMKDCQTVDESMVKIKNSKYYLAPSIALVEDKITALCAVAKESDMEEVVKVYEKKLEEINKDSNAIYDSAFYTTAHNLKTRYMQTKEAFCKIYEHYVRFCICAANNEVEMKSAIKDMGDAFSKLDLPSTDFLTLSKLKSFRDLIQASDNTYTTFVEKAISIKETRMDDKEELQAIENEAKTSWDEVKAMKEEIKAVGRHNASLSRWANAIVVSPDSPQGKYSYIEEEVYE